MSFAKAQDNKKRTGIGEWCDVKRHGMCSNTVHLLSIYFPVLSLASVFCESIAKLPPAFLVLVLRLWFCAGIPDCRQKLCQDVAWQETNPDGHK